MTSLLTSLDACAHVVAVSIFEDADGNEGRQESGNACTWRGRVGFSECPCQPCHYATWQLSASALAARKPCITSTDSQVGGCYWSPVPMSQRTTDLSAMWEAVGDAFHVEVECGGQQVPRQIHTELFEAFGGGHTSPGVGAHTHQLCVQSQPCTQCYPIVT
jgi:hypothetical protein